MYLKAASHKCPCAKQSSHLTTAIDREVSRESRHTLDAGCRPLDNRCLSKQHSDADFRGELSSLTETRTKNVCLLADSIGANTFERHSKCCFKSTEEGTETKGAVSEDRKTFEKSETRWAVGRIQSNGLAGPRGVRFPTRDDLTELFSALPKESHEPSERTLMSCCVAVII